MNTPAVLLAEEALIIWLKAQFKGLIDVIEPMEGAWNEETINQKIKTPPALYVSWIGSKSGRVGEKIHRWTIYLIAKVLNAKRIRPKKELLSHHIIERIETQLESRKLENEHGYIGGPFAHVSTENLWSGGSAANGVSLFALSFDQPMLVADLASSDLPDFLCYFETVHDPQTNEPIMALEVHPNNPDGLPQDGDYDQ